VSAFKASQQKIKGLGVGRYRYPTVIFIISHNLCYQQSSMSLAKEIGKVHNEIYKTVNGNIKVLLPVALTLLDKLK